MDVDRLLIGLGALLLAGCGGADEPRNLNEAEGAYHQSRVPEARATFVRIARDPAAPASDRAQALRETARIAWKMDGDSVAALRALAAAEATGEGSCETGRLRARVLGESRQAAALAGEADPLAARCTKAGGGDPIRLHAARAALDAGDGAVAAKQVAALSEDGAKSLGGASARLDIALLQHDAAGALRAWRDYFWLEGEDLPPALRGRAAPAGAAFREALAPAAPAASKLRLLDLLVKAGFAAPARHFAAAEGLAKQAEGDPLWRRIATYLAVRAELEADLTAAYRREARGDAMGDVGALVDRAADRLAAVSGMQGARADVLRTAYNLYGYVGETGGHGGAHYGHLVEDERRTVSQYGHRANAAFRTLDNMISNGFETWLWDGAAATGGWTEAGPVVVQVRPEYTSAPLRAWKLFSGATEREDLLKDRPGRAAADLRALEAGGGVAYLPGLAERLSLQVADQIGARVSAASGAGRELQRAYLEEYWRAMFQDQMLTHEGRHAIDKGLLWWWQRLDEADVEYRAKLSELALADYPRLALVNIDDATIGGDSAHGKANARIMKALAAWIAGHSKEVRGFNPRHPPMVQIDRLSDAQLRAVARSLEPLLRR